jgi:outer membrane protein OmpU
MFKKLLISSALVAVASSAFAHEKGPTVTLGGNLDTQLGVRDQSHYYENAIADNNTTRVHDTAIVNDTKIHLNVDGKSSHGFNYGGKIVMNADTSDNKHQVADHKNKIGYQTMMYVEAAKLGRFEAGSYTGAYNAMSVAANAQATGGVFGGDWFRWVNQGYVGGTANSAIAGGFLVNPTLLSAAQAGGSDNAAKATFYTPSFMGLKLGVTYIPDMEQYGTVAQTHSVYKTKSTGTDLATAFKNVFSGGLHYAHKFANKFSLKASLLGEVGDAKNNTSNVARKDLQAYEGALALGYSGFTFSGSYGDWGKSGLVKTYTGGKKSSKYWTLGGSYEYGAWGAGVNYMESEAGANMMQLASGNLTRNHVAKVLSFGVDYKVAPGFMPYAEVTLFDMKQKNVTTTTGSEKNKGSVVLIGSKLNF